MSAVPIKVEDEEASPITPPLTRQALQEAMSMELEEWSKKWQVTPVEQAKPILVSDEEPATASAVAAEVVPEEEGKAPQWKSGRRGRKRGSGGWQKKQWHEHRDYVKLTQQYRQRVALTNQLHSAAKQVAEAYSCEALQASRDEATTWSGWQKCQRRSWQQHTRDDMRSGQAERHAEAALPACSQDGGSAVGTATASPLHPNPRARIFPVNPPVGLHSKAAGTPPPAPWSWTRQDTPTTPKVVPPPLQPVTAAAPAAASSSSMAPVTPIAPPPTPEGGSTSVVDERTRAMQTMLRSMAELLNP